MEFKISVVTSEVAEKLNTTKDLIEKRIKDGIELISAATHQFITQKVTKELSDFHRQAFLGTGKFGKDAKGQSDKHPLVDDTAKYVRWNKIAEGVWVVELDEKADWLESGRPPTSMATEDWLLKPGKTKTAKDGCVLNPRNKVLTSLGWKKIKDIKAGDMVLTHSGKFREVKDLLVQNAGVGTKYVNFYIGSVDKSTHNSSKNNDLKSPSISLTEDHLVLTPNGWTEAGKLNKGDLIATPADLKRTCLNCSLPLPINANKIKFCLNNRCSRVYNEKIGKGGLSRLTKEERSINSKKGHKKAKEMGVFDRPDWGARNPEVLKRLRDASAASMRKLISTGKWMPEVFLEKCLQEEGVPFVREFPIKTDRLVNAGNGRKRYSTMYFDFYFPDINVAIELDGERWHSLPESRERDLAKDAAALKKGIKVIRYKSNEIYKAGKDVANKIKLWHQNHSGEIGIAWVKITRIKKGTVNRPDHIYSKKYDICLDADEHSFCCQTVFIHNSTYRSIPFTMSRKTEGKVGNTSHMSKAEDWAGLTNLVKTAMKEAGVHRDPVTKKALIRDSGGQVKLGLIAKLNVKDPGEEYRGLRSKPRSAEQAALSGLKAHSGIFRLSGAAVYQRKDEKTGKIFKETVVFRTVSSKNRAEGRWMAPEQPALNFFKSAHDFAQKQVDELIKTIGEEIRR